MQAPIMDLETLRKHYKPQILEIAARCNAAHVRICGSVARGHTHPESDVDFLVHMMPGSGFCIGGLQWRLEELLGCKVDIIPDTSIHWAIRDKILQEAVEL